MDVTTIAAGVGLGTIIGSTGMMWLNHGWPWKRDSTDESGKGKRSGLVILRDYGTGVEYVCSHFGMCPRLTADGKPMIYAKAPKTNATQATE